MAQRSATFVTGTASGRGTEGRDVGPESNQGEDSKEASSVFHQKRGAGTNKAKCLLFIRSGWWMPRCSIHYSVFFLVFLKRWGLKKEIGNCRYSQL